MYSEDIVNRAKYILGSTSGKNFESMCSALSHDKEGYGNITFGDINEFQEPKVELSHMRFNYSFQELHSFAKKIAAYKISIFLRPRFVEWKLMMSFLYNMWVLLRRKQIVI